MILKIIINMNNAAFEDNPSELGRILKEYALSQSSIDALPLAGTTTKLRDINGNVVGEVSVEKIRYIVTNSFTGEWRAWDNLGEPAYSIDGSSPELKRPVRMLGYERETFLWMQENGKTSSNGPGKHYKIETSHE